MRSIYQIFQKFKYFVILKYQFAKFRCVFFLRQKSDVAKSLKDLLAFAKNVCYNIKEMISNNGTEFDKKEFRIFFEEIYIIPTLSAPYTTEQNGGSGR